MFILFFRPSPAIVVVIDTKSSLLIIMILCVNVDFDLYLFYEGSKEKSVIRTRQIEWKKY